MKCIRNFAKCLKDNKTGGQGYSVYEESTIWNVFSGADFSSRTKGFSWKRLNFGRRT